jgi:hypothetical protein
VWGDVVPEPMAQTRQVCADCLGADDRHDAKTWSDATAADSQRRERENDECELLRFARASKSDDATATAFSPRLTPELSRAAKRLRLECIVGRTAQEPEDRAPNCRCSVDYCKKRV